MTPPTLTPIDCLRGAGPAISNPVYYRFRDRPSLLRAQLNNKVTLKRREDAMAETAGAGARIDAYIAGLEPPFRDAISHFARSSVLPHQRRRKSLLMPCPVSG